LAERGERLLREILQREAGEIAARFPKVLRSNGGYALDRLRVADGRVNAEALLCGSEGTLCVIVGATLNLVSLPKYKGLAVIQFADLLEALEATPVCLEHKPAAVELIDRPILDAAKVSPGMSKRRSFISGDPAAVLAVEVYEDREDRLAERLAGIVADLKGRRLGYAWAVLLDAPRQADVWAVRKAGLGLAQSKPGDRQPQAFIEDCAVDPARLRDYIARLRTVLEEEGAAEAGYYAHASVGCLHIRPVLNLKRRDDVERMVRIADRVSTLTLEFGGTMTGEHGDGIIRSSWLEKMYGPRIVAAFGKIKRAFDPGNILNPGKIVSPLGMTENLRYGGSSVASAPRGRRENGAGDAPCSTSPTGGRRYEAGPADPTFLDFSAHGGMLGLAEMCSGVGECRQRLAGTMCPSYRATGKEKDSTRGRANALRIAMTGGGLLKGFDDAAIAEVMDLCLSCKACKTECPTGVDMAKLKAEWLARRQQVEGVPRRSKLIADLPELAVWGSRFAPLSNWLMQSRLVRTLMEWRYGLDRRVPPPAFVRRTFRDWFAGRASTGNINRAGLCEAGAGGREIVYFVDTWTNYYAPQVGIAAVKVLEALGYRVVVPPTKCCGRPAISKGLLWKAKRLAETNIAVLGPYAEQGIPIVGTEPSCLLALVDEYPQLVRSEAAKAIAKVSVTIEAFVAAELERRPTALEFAKGGAGVLYHGHCHQKALVGTSAAMAVLKAVSGGRAAEIDSGCCGMAGSFGHEAEHYEIARAIGEEKLFPAVRRRGEAGVAVSGFSCRQQIEHHTGSPVRHWVEYLAEAITLPTQ
jgi:Fe-S oxidoreductase